MSEKKGAPPAYTPQGVAPPPGGQQPPPPYYTQPIAQGGQFDQGARFDGVAQARIPPPPPGVQPTAAQMAASQGQSVVMTQEKQGTWTDNGKGGYTWF